jgi:multimeric flavodoxin WrbA
MSKPKIAVVYYSLYGHVRTLALEEKRGLEEVGCEVTLRESRRLFFPLARVLLTKC